MLKVWSLFVVDDASTLVIGYIKMVTFVLLLA